MVSFRASENHAPGVPEGGAAVTPKGPKRSEGPRAARLTAATSEVLVPTLPTGEAVAQSRLAAGGGQAGRSGVLAGRHPSQRVLDGRPVLVHRRHAGQSRLRVFAERLRAAGTRPKVVITAVMRKLLLLVWTLLRSGQPFSPTHGLQPASALTGKTAS